MAATTAAPVKFTSTQDVYNGLQRQPSDGGARMMMFDCRPWPRVEEGKVRDAEVLGVNSGDLRMRGADGSPQPFICKGDVIAIVYDEDSGKASGASKTLKEIIQLLTALGTNKVFALEGGFQAFQQRFPFVCTSKTSTAEELGAANCPWPCEIVQDRLYLGTTRNLNPVQLAALSISAVVDVSPAGVPQAPTAVGYTHLSTASVQEDPAQRLPLLPGLEAISQNEGRVLVCCEDGKSYGSALAVGFVMSQLGLPHLQALAYVMKRKRNIAPVASSYVQLQELEQELGKVGKLRSGVKR